MEGDISEEDESKGGMWALEQKIDQPMDEEAVEEAVLNKSTYFEHLGLVRIESGNSHGNTDVFCSVAPTTCISKSWSRLWRFGNFSVVFCRANDNGQGGTFALYSLLCRHAKVNTIPNQHKTDEELTTYSRSTIHEKSFAAKTQRWLEGNALKKNSLLILVLVGTCMAIGDGILTPAISVLSASGGIKIDHPGMSTDVVIVVSVIILLGLFSLQHYGPSKVGWLFAPVVLLWFLLIGGIGILNIWKYDSGTEALFADLAHFPLSAIQLAFTVVVFPCLLLAYCGQAAYLMKNKEHVHDAFYRSIPDGIYWPVFVIATLAAIVASQATISATFSIIKQANALGCFPRVKVIHTSSKFLGQIYIPDINWILMVLCIIVTAGFKNQSQIGNAYGTAVVIVMLVTTFIMILIMLLVWRCHWILVFIFAALSLVVELTYFSAVIFKVDQGGWVPLVIAAVFLAIMYIWHYGTVKRYEFEMHSRISMAWILGLGPSLGLVRVPGIGLVYTELASGVPHIFSHFITNLPAIHSVVIFVCVKYLPVYTVPEDERFLVKRIGPKNFHMFRCVARYGYKDLHKKDDQFEKKLFENLFMFVRLESMMEGGSDSDEYSIYGESQRSKEFLLPDTNHNTFSSVVDLTVSSGDNSIVPVRSPVYAINTGMSSGQVSSHTEVDETEFLTGCRDAGVVHIMGNTVIRARRDSPFYKKLCIDYVYAFLRKICREHSVIFNVPHESLLNVGQVFYV
ncbi:potassium transporter 11 [Tanacetum coccineum]